MKRLSLILLLVVAVALLALAGDFSVGASGGNPNARQTSAPPAAALAAPDPVLIGAGDIGNCPLVSGRYRPVGTKAAVTAALVSSLLPPNPAEGAVFIAGDNAYAKGTAKEYAECYDPTWGKLKKRTRPVPGNHEYIRTLRPMSAWYARDYFDYFGVLRAGERSKGYYSYDLGEWHILALNSELQGDHMTRQRKWAAEDLTNNKRPCTLAYWHRPLFTSGEHGLDSPTRGVDPTMQRMWRTLDEMGVDLVVNGHDHNYERFHAQDADGNATSKGIVEFVVGTGGADLRPREIPPAQRRNSAAFDKLSWGVLRLTLRSDSYEYEFHTAATKVPGHVFRDKSQNPVPCGD